MYPFVKINICRIKGKSLFRVWRKGGGALNINTRQPFITYSREVGGLGLAVASARELHVLCVFPGRCRGDFVQVARASIDGLVGCVKRS